MLDETPEVRRQRNLVVLEDFLRSWELGTTIERGPDERFDRDQMAERMFGRAEREAGFRRALFDNPRLVFMMVLEEAMSINRLNYLSQIDEVTLLEETEDELFLVIPECHYGCLAEEVETPPDSAESLCHVCGRSLPVEGCQTAAEALRQPGLDRSSIEKALLARAARERDFRDALLAQPMEIYTEYARLLCSGQPPSYLEGVRSIRVSVETDRSVFFVAPAEVSRLVATDRAFGADRACREVQGDAAAQGLTA